MWMLVNYVEEVEEVIRAEKGAGMLREGIRDKMILIFGTNNGRKLAKKAAQPSYCPLKFGCEKKYSRGLWSVWTTKLSPER